jgi:preprotein translocase subunit SecY
MVGILARFPQAFIQEFTTRVTNNNGGCIGYQIIIWLVIVACVFLTMAIRKNTSTASQLQVILNKI